MPSVLFAFLHGQPVGFSGFLELPVVVGTRTGSVLNIVLKVLKVNHFVKQGSTGFFKGHFTFPTENMNFLGGPDDGSATGANIFAGT